MRRYPVGEPRQVVQSLNQLSWDVDCQMLSGGVLQAHAWTHLTCVQQVRLPPTAGSGLVVRNITLKVREKQVEQE